MFEDYYLERIELMNPTGVLSSGEMTFDIYNCSCRVVSEVSTLSGVAEEVTSQGRVFLIRSDVAPVIGSRLVYKEQLLVIGEIQCCRNFDGQIECYRCKVR